MGHLTRAVILLVGLLLVVFVAPRIIPVPAELENFGFYPPSNEEDAKKWAALPINYVDTKLCQQCHQDNYSTWQQANHSDVSCESCHGPGSAHVSQGEALIIDTARETCGRCHARVLARQESFPQIDFEKHGAPAECITCHNPHEPSQNTMVSPAIPHPLEGRDSCLVCHNSSSAIPFPADHEGITQENCLSCHQSK